MQRNTPTRTPGSIRIGALVVTLLLPLAGTACAQAMTDEPALSPPLAMIHALYDELTFDAGQAPNWDTVRAMFMESAPIILRTSRQATTVFTVDSFVEDFQQFIIKANLKDKGFEEKIVKTKSLVFGDMAHIFVTYAAHVPGSERPPQLGVDSFQMARRDGAWKIVSLINEVPLPGNPLPEELK